MAYTEAQWNNLQRQLPVEDRMSYGEYVATLSPEEQRQIYLASLTPAERRKILEAGPSAVTTVDERTKLAGARTDTAAQATATATAAQQEATRAALAALTSGQPLTDAQKALLDIKTTPTTKTYTAAELQAIAAKLGAGKPLTPEEAAAVGSTVSGTPVGTVTGTPVVTQTSGEPPNKPGNAWVVSADGKSWVIPPKPTDGKTYTWDDNKGWVAGTATKDPGKAPGAAWILNADKTEWIKPPQPNPTDTWDDEKGWIPAAGGGDKYETINGVLTKNGEPYTGTYQGKEYVNGKLKTDNGGDGDGGDGDGGDGDGDGGDATPERPVGTPPAFIWDPVSKTWKMPPKPTTKGNWLFDPNTGWVDTTVIPGASGTSAVDTRTLAVNTFKNTLALFFGPAEMSKPWVDELYKLVNPYYKSGSSVDEALNLAIQEGRNNPNLKEFTSRFSGIYALQDKLNQGIAVTVPTIAEYFASEAKMGDVLNQAGLSSLNQQSYLGDIIGKGVNVTEFTNRINNVFLRIDQLPQQAKDFISGSFPTLDKTQLAKAILGGEKGAIQLSKELGGLEVQAAFKAQGLGVDTATGLDIASRGFGYQETLTGAGTVAQNLPTYEKLQEITTGKDVKTEQAQKELQGVVFNKSIVDSMRAEQLANQEVARFRGSSGLAGSKSLASQQRGAGLI